MTQTASASLPPQPPEWPGTLLHAYLSALKFLVWNTARDSTFAANHLLSYLADDLTQSVVALTTFAREGALSVARRELRLIIESSIKICYVQQHRYASSVAEKLAEFDKVLASTNISIKRDLKLTMLPAPLSDALSEEIGRLYGKMSEYVHLTPNQILERIAAVDAGRSIGFEAPAESEVLRELASKSLAASLVLLLHSVPEYVAGDWLVEADGSTVTSYLLGSRFIAAMDGFFDYKAERQARLDEVQSARAARISF